MNETITLKILDVDFDFDGEHMSWDDQRNVTESVIGSLVTVEKDDPDQTLEDLACELITDQEGYCIYDIKVQQVSSDLQPA